VFLIPFPHNKHLIIEVLPNRNMLKLGQGMIPTRTTSVGLSKKVEN
jgi:hypothetical protein